MIPESFKECFEVRSGDFRSFQVKGCIILCVILACLPFLLVINIHGLSLFHKCQFCCTLLCLCTGHLCMLSSSKTYTFRRVVAIASFFFLVINLLSKSLRMSAQMSMSFHSTSESLFNHGSFPFATIFARTQPILHLPVLSSWPSLWKPLTRRRLFYGRLMVTTTLQT